MKSFTLIVLLLFTVSCKKAEKNKAILVPSDKVLDQLYGYMQGSFNSKNQANLDSTYYNIILHMYPIWENRGKFLYVEQALSSMSNNPYRQRIYELSRVTDSTIASIMYEIPNDSLYIGQWQNKTLFDTLNITDLKLRKGCDVILKQITETTFKGGTIDPNCLSDFRKAAYSTSQVEICKDQIISWDRGYNNNDEYVWGAEKEGYVFDRIIKENSSR